ncbi:MAG: response regulator, partial [Verrucomicrobia bacterium]|nr:response regulator [Verrucomicrobiota bacterium]
DVLKFMRSEASLKALPVIILSNCYNNEMAREAREFGIKELLLKIRCSPSVLVRIIDDSVASEPSGEDGSNSLAVPERSPPKLPSLASTGVAEVAAPASLPGEASATGSEFQGKASRNFLQNAPETCAALRSLCQAIATAPNVIERGLRLQDLYRKINIIGAAAGLAGCHDLAQMASAFGTLLFDLIAKPTAFQPSFLRTAADTVDFLTLLFERAQNSDFGVPLSAEALVVDDDALNNRLITAALQILYVNARSTDDPLVGLQWLTESHYDLVLLDILMPGMNGFELCRELRKLPGYRSTPVIYVTSYHDSKNRAQSMASGGNDLIAKPVFPLELAVKAVAHLLKYQMAAH